MKFLYGLLYEFFETHLRSPTLNALDIEACSVAEA